VGVKLVAKKRTAILAELPDFFPKMQVDEKRSGPNRIRSFDERYKAAVSLDYGGRAKKWMLTVYDEPLASRRRTSVPETLANESGETPSPTSGQVPLPTERTSVIPGSLSRESGETPSPGSGAPDSNIASSEGEVNSETDDGSLQSRTPAKGKFLTYPFPTFRQM
jgi:hypothetical protein